MFARHPKGDAAPHVPKALVTLKQRTPSMVATQEEILPSSSFGEKQPRTTDVRRPPSSASGLGSHPQPSAHSPLQIILSEHEQGGGWRSWLHGATQEQHQERQK